MPLALLYSKVYLVETGLTFADVVDLGFSS
jgi:hypothetical protein